MKRVGPAVGGDFPRARHAGRGLTRGRVLQDQALKQRILNSFFRVPDRDVWVEIRRFGAVTDEERLRTEASFDVGLALGAGGKSEQYGKGCCDEAGCFHGWGTTRINVALPSHLGMRAGGTPPLQRAFP